MRQWTMKVTGKFPATRAVELMGSGPDESPTIRRQSHESTLSFELQPQTIACRIHSSLHCGRPSFGSWRPPDLSPVLRARVLRSTEYDRCRAFECIE